MGASACVGLHWALLCMESGEGYLCAKLELNYLKPTTLPVIHPAPFVAIGPDSCLTPIVPVPLLPHLTPLSLRCHVVCS